MKVAKLAAGAGLEDPAGAGWKEVAGETVVLSPVPLDEQPNAYIQEAWQGRAYGETPEAKSVTVPGGGESIIGPFPVRVYGSTCSVSYSDATGVTVAVLVLTPSRLGATKGLPPLILDHHQMNLAVLG